MPAMLERKWKDRKASVNDLPLKEVLFCPDCDVTYTLSYTKDENHMKQIGGEWKNNLGMIRNKASDTIRNEHASHSTSTFMWHATGREQECDWFEVDTMAARKAL